MSVLRQSTQVVVRIGPAVAVGDGFTPVTTLDLSTADEAELLKAAGAATVSIAAATFAAIAGADGWYDLTLTTSHTDTVGTLDVVVNDDSLILPIFARFQVVEEAAYDAIYAASASPATTAGAVGSVTGAVGSVAAGGITAASLAADCITAAKVAADVSAEIADAVWDEDATGHQVTGTFGQAIGDPVADTATIFGAVVTNAAGVDIAADLLALDNLVDDLESRVGTPSDLGGGATVAANLVDIEGQTDDIGAAGAGLTALAQASVLGAVADVAADGDPTATDTVVAYLKQIINTLEGSAGIVTFPAEAAPANAVNLAEVIRAIHADVTGIAGAAMRGTDSAALATVCTEARLAELDAANLPTDVAGVQADTDNIQTRIPAALNNGVMPADVQRINDVEIIGDGNVTPFDVA